MSANTQTPSTSPVLCAGILVADIFIPPLEGLPQAGQLLATEDFLIDTGGCAANVATGLSRLGVSVAVSGKVGGDLFGDFVINDLAKKDADTRGILKSETSGTSKTVVLPVKGEDRRFIHTFGANAEFNEADIAASLTPDTKVFYIGGFLIMPSLDAQAVARLFQAAKANGAKTILDVVVPANDANAMRLLEAALPYADYFMPNDEEAHSLTGETDARRQAERFLEAGCGTVIITKGAHGTLIMEPDRILEAPVYAIDYVDGSGSGDAFAAGFILGVLEGWSLPETLRFASAIGASACTKLGCTTGVFTRAEAEAFLASRPLAISEEKR